MAVNYAIKRVKLKERKILEILKNQLLAMQSEITVGLHLSDFCYLNPTVN